MLSVVISIINNNVENLEDSLRNLEKCLGHEIEWDGIIIDENNDHKVRTLKQRYKNIDIFESNGMDDETTIRLSVGRSKYDTVCLVNNLNSSFDKLPLMLELLKDFDVVIGHSGNKQTFSTKVRGESNIGFILFKKLKYLSRGVFSVDPLKLDGGGSG